MPYFIPHLHAFSDANLAGDRDDFISTWEYFFYLGRNPISWSSKKQQSVARSSTEVEYRSVVQTILEVLSLLNVLHEIGVIGLAQPVI